MEKNFGNWLVVSDVDGTLNNKLRMLPKRNRKDICTFVELGGNFTLASGRAVNSLEPHYFHVSCNVPAVVLNGSGIYDFQKKKMIWRHPLGQKGKDFVREVYESFPRLEIGVFFDSFVYLLRDGILSNGQLFFDGTPHKPCAFQDVPADYWCKAVFWGVPRLIDQLVALSKTRFHANELNFMRTSPFSFELVDGGVHKGVAVMQLAAQIGIAHSHVAAIGDYYNDLDMLRTVGLPACAGQAPKDLHSVCKFEACHCNRGCVGDLLEYIMKLEEAPASYR